MLVSERVLVTGDLLVHAIQLLHPELTYGHDMDPAQARESRVRMLDAHSRLASSHLGKPFP